MKDLSLFASVNRDFGVSLAERLRPKDWSEVLGQDAAVSRLKRIVDQKLYTSFIFSGPPGVGKTTLARLLAEKSGAEFELLSATDSGVKDMKELHEKGRTLRLMQQKKLLVLVDEIHRFSKSQQDVLLPAVESGDIWLVGATTENVRVSLNSALLSRVQIIPLLPLSENGLEQLVDRGLRALQIQPGDFWTADVRSLFLALCDRDGRRCLLYLETLAGDWDRTGPWNIEKMQELLGNLSLRFDLQGDQHYTLISALIKSIRGSDPDAALYYLARLILGGEDPRFVARRLVILASEDIGNADPRALSVATACAQAVELVGLPEAELCFAQAVTYLATCPKSNASYKAWNAAKELVKRTGTLAVPEHLLSHSKSYKYPHDYPRHFVEQNYWPKEFGEKPNLYQPSQLGFEKTLHEYHQWLRGKTTEV